MRCGLIISFALLMLLSGCGRQHQAETAVKDFIDDNAVAKINIIHIGKLDSTVNVTDSLMGVMRKRVEASPNWKNGIEYAPYKFGQKQPLYYVRVRYSENSDTLSGAFYLSPDLKKVAGFI